MCFIAGVFAFFQALMPMLGWICVHTIMQYFQAFEKMIPWIALALLGFIGGKMLFESLKKDSDGELNKKARALTVGALLLQAFATSIDALTAGINLAKDYSLMQYLYVLLSVAIIAIITLAICICGVKLGQKVGTKLSNKAGILGGSVLIFLGLKILITDIILPA